MNWQSFQAKFGSEKGQTRSHSTSNNFISLNTIVCKIQTLHTIGFEITATPQGGILFTASLH